MFYSFFLPRTGKYLNVETIELFERRTFVFCVLVLDGLFREGFGIFQILLEMVDQLNNGPADWGTFSVCPYFLLACCNFPWKNKKKKCHIDSH